MWDTPFSPEFLDAKEGVVIRCPEEYLSYELFDLLKENGITWRGGGDTSNTNWNNNGADTAYFVLNRCVLYGPYIHADCEAYEKYIKCTFYGIDTSDFDVASENEIFSFLTH